MRYMAAIIGIGYVAILVGFVADIHIHPPYPIVGPAHDSRWDDRYMDMRDRGYNKKEAKEWADTFTSPCL